MRYRWPPQLRLKHTLVADNRTSRWLSEQTGLSMVTITGIISGRVRPTPRSRDLISVALRRPADELFEQIDDEPDDDDDQADDLDDGEPWQTMPPLDDETIDRLRRLLFPQHARRVKTPAQH